MEAVHARFAEMSVENGWYKKSGTDSRYIFIINSNHFDLQSTKFGMQTALAVSVHWHTLCLFSSGP